jgi:hypothetical protein
MPPKPGKEHLWRKLKEWKARLNREQESEF